MATDKDYTGNQSDPMNQVEFEVQDSLVMYVQKFDKTSSTSGVIFYFFYLLYRSRKKRSFLVARPLRGGASFRYLKDQGKWESPHPFDSPGNW